MQIARKHDVDDEDRPAAAVEHAGDHALEAGAVLQIPRIFASSAEGIPSAETLCDVFELEALGGAQVLPNADAQRFIAAEVGYRPPTRPGTRASPVRPRVRHLLKTMRRIMTVALAETPRKLGDMSRGGMRADRDGRRVFIGFRPIQHGAAGA